MENYKSLAVKDLEIERERQRSGDALDEGVEDTFLAPEPVSASTITILPQGSSSVTISDAPRVDEALESILEHRNDPYVEPREQLSALRDEVESLKYRLTDDVRNRIRAQPWQAVGLAIAVGFIFGVTR